MIRLIKRAGVTMALGSALLVSLAATAPPASATTVASGVNIRPCVNLGAAVCSPVGATHGTGIKKIRCWRDGSWATGKYRSNRWFLVYLSDEREGYVHSSFVSGQYSTPNCSNLAYVRAADKALSYYGQAYAPSDIASRYQDWAPGPYAEWSGDCSKMVSSAYLYGAGVSYVRANAIGQYRAYRDAGQILGGIPRYGAPVFYNIAQPYGHTAIYIGGTTILTTQGMDNARLPVVRKSLYDYGNYLGWAKVG